MIGLKIKLFVECVASSVTFIQRDLNSDENIIKNLLLFFLLSLYFYIICMIIKIFLTVGFYRIRRLDSAIYTRFSLFSILFIYLIFCQFNIFLLERNNSSAPDLRLLSRSAVHFSGIFFLFSRNIY